MMNGKEGYTLEIYNNMTGEWDRSTVEWRQRYQDARKQWEAYVSDAKNAQLLRKFRIVNTKTNVIYDEWSNEAGHTIITLAERES